MASWLARLFGRKETGPVRIEPVWIEISELRDRLGRGERPVILDVRGPDEFNGPLGHIEGAWNVPLPEFSSRIPEIKGETGAIVVVCLTDKRSAHAAALLAKSGFLDVAVLRGGMRAWRGA